MPSVELLVSLASWLNARSASWACWASARSLSPRLALTVVRDAIELGAALPVGPAHDLRHAAAGAGGGVEQRRQALLGGPRPEASVLDAVVSGGDPCAVSSAWFQVRRWQAATRCDSAGSRGRALLPRAGSRLERTAVRAPRRPLTRSESFPRVNVTSSFGLLPGSGHQSLRSRRLEVRRAAGESGHVDAAPSAMHCGPSPRFARL